MVTTDPRIERLKEHYASELDHRLRDKFVKLEAGLGAILLGRELGVGINDGSDTSRLEQTILRFGLQADIRRDRIVRAFQDFRSEVCVNVSGSLVALWPEADIDESEQNVDAVLALNTGRFWYSVVNFYMKEQDPETGSERIARRGGVPEIMPALFKGERPSRVTNPSSQTARYFPDSPANKYEWRTVEEMGLGRLAVATGFTTDQLEILFGN